MELLLPNDEIEFSSGFLRFLCYKLKLVILSNLNNKRLKLFTEQFKKVAVEYELLTESEARAFDARRLVIKSLSRIKYRQVKGGFIIYFDLDLPYMTYGLSMGTICRLLNDGNFDLAGYPIFTNATNVLYKNIRRYYTEYKKMMFGGMYTDVYSTL